MSVWACVCVRVFACVCVCVWACVCVCGVQPATWPCFQLKQNFGRERLTMSGSTEARLISLSYELNPVCVCVCVCVFVCVCCIIAVFLSETGQDLRHLELHCRHQYSKYVEPAAQKSPTHREKHRGRL